MVLFVKLKISLYFSIFSTFQVDDIAVVKVTPPFKFNDKIQKTTLPDPSFETEGTFTTVNEYEKIGEMQFIFTRKNCRTFDGSRMGSNGKLYLPTHSQGS